MQVVQHVLDAGEGPVELRFRDGQRRGKAHHGLVRLFAQDARTHQLFADLAGAGIVRIDLHADEQPQTAQVFNEGTREALQFLQEVFAELGGAFPQSLFDQ